MLHENNTSSDTEELIKRAAKKVFLKKGLAGTRLQEIADEAGIGRTALHYYFRSKEKLFAVVWGDLFEETRKRMTKAVESEMPVIQQLQVFASNYFDSALREPEIDIFMLNEFNNNSAMINDILSKIVGVNPGIFLLTEIEKGVKKGEIKGDPKQILITVFSICFFSFAGKAMLRSMMNISEEAYMQLMQQRKEFVLQFLETAFRG